MASTAPETKAQRVERLKRSKNPWEGLDEIRRFAREGFASIPPEWIGTYFRWWGVYTQGDGAGVTGGQGGEGRRAIESLVSGSLSGRQLGHQPEMQMATPAATSGRMSTHLHAGGPGGLP